MKRTMQQGFTLIELMIVIAIIGILAAIAIPAYQNYVIRAQVSEGPSLAQAAKTAVATYFAQNGTFPTNNTSAGIASSASISGAYVSSVHIANGQIVISYQDSSSSSGKQKANSAINNDQLILSPFTNAGSIAWICGTGGTNGPNLIKTTYLPSSCRNTIQ